MRSATVHLKFVEWVIRRELDPSTVLVMVPCEEQERIGLR